MKILAQIDPAVLLARLRALPRRTGGKRGGPRWLQPLTPAEGDAIQADEAERIAVGRELARLNKPIRDELGKCTWMPGFDSLHPLRVPDGRIRKDMVVYMQLAEEAIAKRNFSLEVDYA